MTAKSRWLASGLFLTSILAVPTSASAELGTLPVGLLPVQWSTRLEVENLQQVKARLNQRFAEPVDEYSEEPQDTGVAKNCLELFDLRQKNLRGAGSIGYRYERYFGARCLAIQALPRLTPAKVSYLDKFRLDPAAVDVLPADLSASFENEDKARQEKAVRRHLTLRQVAPSLKAKLDANVGDLVIVDSTHGWEVRIDELARGDFNDDGIQDILVEGRSRSLRGNFAEASLLVLSRKNNSGKFYVVETLQ